jgi:hypothetical protein
VQLLFSSQIAILQMWQDLETGALQVSELIVGAEA